MPAIHAYVPEQKVFSLRNKQLTENKYPTIVKKK